MFKVDLVWMTLVTQQHFVIGDIAEGLFRGLDLKAHGGARVVDKVCIDHDITDRDGVMVAEFFEGYPRLHLVEPDREVCVSKHVIE